MKRAKITDRNNFDAWDKIELSKKSNNRCAHCGTKLIQGVNTTVDHFVPLSKGGINQRINIVILCEKCNKEKGDRIINPTDYLPYLNTKDYDNLHDYFQSYIQSFEFVERRNLLACDQYTINIYTGPNLDHITNKKTRQHMLQTIRTKYSLIRATDENIQEMETFFIKYLKKYNDLHSEQTVSKNIEFWMKFGCIYLIRNEKTNAIETMIPITVRQNKRTKIDLVVNIFSYYVTYIVGYLTDILPEYIARRVITEQNIPNICISACIPIYDKIQKFITWDCVLTKGHWITTYRNFSIKKKGEDYTKKELEQKEKFYAAFNNITEEVNKFFQKPENEYIQYMRDYVIEDDTDEDTNNEVPTT